MRLSGSRAFVPVVEHTFEAAQVPVPKAEQTGALHEMTGAPGFLNTYYDDEGWWALAWIDAYDLTREQKFLTMSRSIFADMAGGWDNTCGGGIWWSKDRTYKNAIANELFFRVAAELGLRTRGAEQRGYADWAAREWRWFDASGMINSANLVNDGLTIDAQTGACTNNGKTTWTYNQGVILGGLAARAKLAHQKDLLRRAETIADSALAHLTGPDGVLRESCEPNCGADGVQFKGIFVRNLRALNDRVHQGRYQRFLEQNADAIWQHDRGQADGVENALGISWAGPFATADAGTQSSALDALVSVLR
jgi:predicted alpha-1,6-mannanase (GH76 family)